MVHSSTAFTTPLPTINLQIHFRRNKNICVFYVHLLYSLLLNHLKHATFDYVTQVKASKTSIHTHLHCFTVDVFLQSAGGSAHSRLGSGDHTSHFYACTNMPNDLISFLSIPLNNHCYLIYLSSVSNSLC